MIRKASTILLVLVAIAGVTAAVYRQSSGPAPATLEPEARADGTTGPRVTVTYFTTNVRCASCIRIEELTRETVHARFADLLEAGKVSFRMINTDDPGNQHYIQDYQLVSKSVVVSESLNGEELEWVNLQDIWLLLRDEQAFADYVAGAVSTYL
jgi:hypothetical protein